MSGLIVRPRSRIFHGHEWVFQSEVQKVYGAPKDGEVISLKDGRDRFLGSAIYNSRSQIAARRFSRRRQLLDAEFFQRRIGQAVELRQSLGLAGAPHRVVWSESDGLPGLIVDRYGSVLVLQTLTTAMDDAREIIADALMETCSGVDCIIERNDASIRVAEGLEPRVGFLRGEGNSGGLSADGKMDVSMGGLTFHLDLLSGQKTGFYLDQTDNYALVAAYAHGRRVLDCFSNQGAFALHCAKAGASEVVAVESSADCVGLAKQNAATNGLTVEWKTESAFDYLSRADKAGERFDLVVLDPPSFTKSKSRVSEAMRGYKEIHMRAMRILNEGGLLATFTCSHHIDDALLDSVITDALVDAKRSFRQVMKFAQRPDHPVMAGLPETEYLRGRLLAVAPSR